MTFTQTLAAFSESRSKIHMNPRRSDMISNYRISFKRDGKMSRNNENKTALLTSTLTEMGQIKRLKLSLACHVFMRGKGHEGQAQGGQ